MLGPSLPSVCGEDGISLLRRGHSANGELRPICCAALWIPGMGMLSRVGCLCDVQGSIYERDIYESEENYDLEYSDTPMSS